MTTTARHDYSPGTSPDESLKIYMKVLAEGVTDPQLPLYTPATRSMLESWLITPAQQLHELRRLEDGIGSRQVLSSGEVAVIRFPVERRDLPPYFLKSTQAGWHIDLEPMSRYVGFNHKNQWHFRTMPEAYAFAFADWRFDRYGFPHRR